MDKKNMEAAIFFDSYLPDALSQALLYAGDDGFVASMPQLLRARVDADYDNIIWNTWFTSNSEESLVNTPQGNPVIVTVHGSGIFATPERFRKLYHSSVDRSSKTGFTGLFAAKITEHEASNVLQGKLPDASEIPVYPFAEFKRGDNDLPRCYAVVMDYKMAKQCKNGYASFEELQNDPLMIVRAGGVQGAKRYLDRAQARHHTTKMGSWHSYNDAQFNPEQLQSSVALLGGNLGGVDSDLDDDKVLSIESDFGLRSDVSMIDLARFVAVSPQDTSKTLRDLQF